MDIINNFWLQRLKRHQNEDQITFTVKYTTSSQILLFFQRKCGSAGIIRTSGERIIIIYFRNIRFSYYIGNEQRTIEENAQ